MTDSAKENEIVSEIHIAATPEQVFQALVDPDQVVQWWGAVNVYRCTSFRADLRVGGKWQSSGVMPQGGNFEVFGEFLEIDRPRVLAYTWVASWTGDAKSVVRWELTPAENGTLLRIRHGDFADGEIAKNYRGWPRMLGWLQVFVEKGLTVETRKAS